VYALPAGSAGLATAVGPAVVTARSHRLRLVDGEASASELMLVELRNSTTCALIVVHLDERESSCLSGGTIANNIDGGDGASSLEERLKIGLVGFVRQVADVQLGTHELLLHLEDANRSDGRLERDARRRHAGEAKGSNLLREAGMRSSQKAHTV